MAKRAPTVFRAELDRLFKRRTHWLRTAVEGPPPGKPPRLKKRDVSKTVKRLQDCASSALANNLARREFETSVRGKKRWHPKKGKGRGVDAKRQSFKRWFLRSFGKGMFVYVFWKGKQCEYVGKTTKPSPGRIASHFDKHWFGGVTRVDVYRASGKRALPALECLTIHRFQPRRNKFRAEKRRYTRRCPLCRIHRRIGDELGSIFRFR